MEIKKFLNDNEYQEIKDIANSYGMTMLDFAQAFLSKMKSEKTAFTNTESRVRVEGYMNEKDLADIDKTAKKMSMKRTVFIRVALIYGIDKCLNDEKYFEKIREDLSNKKNNKYIRTNEDRKNKQISDKRYCIMLSADTYSILKNFQNELGNVFSISEIMNTFALDIDNYNIDYKDFNDCCKRLGVKI